MRHLILPFFAATALAGSAIADVKGVFKEAWTCAKSVPHSAYTIAKDIKDKGEAVASMSASIGVRTAQTGGQPQMLAFTTGVLAMIKASKPGILPTGQCESSIKNELAKPFALGIAAILPESSVRTQLLDLAQSERSTTWIWNTLTSAPPPFGTIPSQISCGCNLIDNSLTLADVSAVSNVIKNTSKSCSGILDEAGLGFINKWGSAGIAYVGGKYRKLDEGFQKLQGKKEAQPDEAVQRAFFGVYLKDLAEDMAASKMKKGAGSAESAWAVSDVSGGWAVEAVGFCTHPMTFSNVCMIRLGDMTNKCKFYYSTKVNGGGQAAKCDQWRTEAVATVSKDAQDLVTQANSMTVFRLKLYGQMQRDWLWRLPPCEDYRPMSVMPVWAKGEENKCDLTTVMKADVWKLGGYQDNSDKPWEYTATGAFAQARRALIDANYDTGLAHQAVLGGLYFSAQAATLSAWNTSYSRENVRARWLKQWMPSQPMLGAYGCKGGAPWGPECAVQIEKAFDSVCHGLIRDAFVLPPNVLGVAFKFGAARKDCTALLQAVRENAETLSEAGLTEVESKANAACPSTHTDRGKAGRCRQALSDLWFGCAKPNISNVFGAALGDTKKCFNNRSLRMLDLKANQPPRAITVPPGGFKPMRVQ